MIKKSLMFLNINSARYMITTLHNSRLLSSAVMQQRTEPMTSFDYFPTPLWATRAIMEKMHAHIDQDDLIYDPGCGEGHMVRALKEKYKNVICSDIQDFGYGATADYLDDETDGACDWTFMNPPFKYGLDFILKALKHSRKGVCVLARSSLTEGQKRYRELFRPFPHTYKYQFVERVVISKGRVRNPSVKYYCVKAQKWKFPTTATNYCWLVWVRKNNHEPLYRFIEPSRLRLEKAGDYGLIT